MCVCAQFESQEIWLLAFVCLFCSWFSVLHTSAVKASRRKSLERRRDRARRGDEKEETSRAERDGVRVKRRQRYGARERERECTSQITST